MGRRVVWRRLKGMTAAAVTAALEDAHFDARQDSRHEHLAGDERDRAELEEREAAAYCLHLHHLCLGESRRAWHWFHQLTHSMDDTAPPDAAFPEGLEIFARYGLDNGSRVLAPSGRLESEVDRLAARTPGCSVIVARPDRQLVARLEEFTPGR
jgi:hypothetical protein